MLKPLVQLDHIAAQVQLVLVADAMLEATLPLQDKALARLARLEAFKQMRDKALAMLARLEALALQVGRQAAKLVVVATSVSKLNY